jgi:uncharacterized DUF497 family protein
VTLELRGLDMADVGTIFDGLHVTLTDDRADYGEMRFITLGHLAGRMGVIVWTQRGDTCRIISLRKANEREQTHYGSNFT